MRDCRERGEDPGAPPPPPSSPIRCAVRSPGRFGRAQSQRGGSERDDRGTRHAASAAAAKTNGAALLVSTRQSATRAECDAERFLA